MCYVILLQSELDCKNDQVFSPLVDDNNCTHTLQMIDHVLLYIFLQVTIDVPDTQGRTSPVREGHTIVRETKDGLLNIKALLFLCLWYVFSAGTLFSNKYILSNLLANPTFLGESSTSVLSVLTIDLTLTTTFPFSCVTSNNMMVNIYKMATRFQAALLFMTI